jgi:hypothetical protein
LVKPENRNTVGQAAASSGLAIADQWANFRDQFKALSEEGERRKFDLSWNGKIGRKLRADDKEAALRKKGFNAISQPTTWELGGIVDVEDLRPPTDAFVTHFESVVERAAHACGLPGGTLRVRDWLKQVLANPRDWFNDLPLACAAFCSQLERQALEESSAAKGDADLKPQGGKVLSELAQRGRDVLQIKEETRRIKNLARTRGHSLGEIETNHPEFLVWKFAKTLNQADKDVFDHPRQWATGYINETFLEKYYGRSYSTIKTWIAAFRQATKVTNK